MIAQRVSPTLHRAGAGPHSASETAATRPEDLASSAISVVNRASEHRKQIRQTAARAGQNRGGNRAGGLARQRQSRREARARRSVGLKAAPRRCRKQRRGVFDRAVGPEPNRRAEAGAESLTKLRPVRGRALKPLTAQTAAHSGRTRAGGSPAGRTRGTQARAAASAEAWNSCSVQTVVTLFLL